MRKKEGSERLNGAGDKILKFERRQVVGFGKGRRQDVA